MAVTQKDIANRLGVSRELVKGALNGYPDVAETTRVRIFEEAKRMGYNAHSNHSARAMAALRNGRSIKTGHIAVVIGGMVITPAQDPFFGPLLEGITIEAARQERHVTTFTLWESNDKELPPLIAARAMDGVICTSVWPTIYDQSRALGLPVAVLNWDEDSTILPDLREGTRQATRHLIDLGHRNIAFLGRVDLPGALAIGYNIKERVAGYKAALSEAGLPEPKESWIDLTAPGPGPVEGTTGLQNLLARNNYQRGKQLPFSALVCYNDAIAMGAIRSLESIGLRVPADISVVGFDDISANYFFHPEITSVKIDRKREGELAMQLLGEQIDLDLEKRPHKPPQVRWNPELVIHETTCPSAQMNEGKRRLSNAEYSAK
jgi:DNA-binding LacI/PurR family transcriptional regulator